MAHVPYVESVESRARSPVATLVWLFCRTRCCVSGQAFGTLGGSGAAKLVTPPSFPCLSCRHHSLQHREIATLSNIGRLAGRRTAKFYHSGHGLRTKSMGPHLRS